MPILQPLDQKIQTHKHSQFTGVTHIGLGKSVHWSIYFHMGRMVWANSRIHPVRRWHRQLLKHCPHLVQEYTTGTGENQVVKYDELHYSRLVAKVREGKINRINMAKAIEDYLSEVLFDIVHQGSLRQLHGKVAFTIADVEKRFSSSSFLIVRAEQAWQQAQYDWQSWQQAELVKCSPNLAPIIGNPEELKKRTSEPVYQHLINIVDGTQTFRDMAVHLNQPLLPLTRRIVPYIRQGVMGLVQINDLGNKPSEQAAAQQKKSTNETSANPSTSSNPPISAQQRSSPAAAPPNATKTTTPSPKQIQTLASSNRPAKTTKAASNAPLIIYIDDSSRDSKTMGDILQDAGFRYRNIQESTHALPLLIEHKPQLIFLDLVMPVANGYEICSQVRRVSLFKDIPIVIVTGNDTVTDRVRAKLVGASGFLTKPIKRTKVLKVVHKFLNRTSGKPGTDQQSEPVRTGRTQAQTARKLQKPLQPKSTSQRPTSQRMSS